MITGLPPCRCAIPGPLVETGSLVARVCDVAMPGDEFLGEGEGDADGEGDGDGEMVGDGEGSATTGVAVMIGATVFNSGVAAEVCFARRP